MLQKVPQTAAEALAIQAALTGDYAGLIFTDNNNKRSKNHDLLNEIVQNTSLGDNPNTGNPIFVWVIGQKDFKKYTETKTIAFLYTYFNIHKHKYSEQQQTKDSSVRKRV